MVSSTLSNLFISICNNFGFLSTLFCHFLRSTHIVFLYVCLGRVEGLFISMFSLMGVLRVLFLLLLCVYPVLILPLLFCLTGQ